MSNRALRNCLLLLLDFGLILSLISMHAEEMFKGELHCKNKLGSN